MAANAAQVLVKTHNIDSNGEIYLLVQNAVKLQVSSKIMGFHSRVFEAMLHGSFTESLKLAQASSAQPLEIELPDDDPETATVLCQILHGKILSI